MKNKMLESFLWMLLIAIAPLLVEQLEAGKAIWEVDWKVISTGVTLAVIRLAINYKNPNDPRYGPNKNQPDEQ